MKQLSQLQKSDMIKDLAEKFGVQVRCNDVSSTGANGGNCISSYERDVPTTAAPTAIAQYIDELAENVQESCMPDELPTILHNLSRAKSSLVSAHMRVSSPTGPDLAGLRHDIKSTIEYNLPNIDQTIAKISRLTR